MQASVSSLSAPHPPYSIIRSDLNLRLCDLRKGALGFHSPSQFRNFEPRRIRIVLGKPRSQKLTVLSALALAADNESRGPSSFDYDLVIIGAGVGGHGAALHAVEKVGALIL